MISTRRKRAHTKRNNRHKKTIKRVIHRQTKRKNKERRKRITKKRRGGGLTSFLSKVGTAVGTGLSKVGTGLASGTTILKDGAKGAVHGLAVGTQAAARAATTGDLNVSAAYRSIDKGEDYNAYKLGQMKKQKQIMVGDRFQSEKDKLQYNLVQDIVKKTKSIHSKSSLNSIMIMLCNYLHDNYGLDKPTKGDLKINDLTSDELEAFIQQNDEYESTLKDKTPVKDKTTGPTLLDMIHVLKQLTKLREKMEKEELLIQEAMEIQKDIRAIQTEYNTQLDENIKNVNAYVTYVNQYITQNIRENAFEKLPESYNKSTIANFYNIGNDIQTKMNNIKINTLGNLISIPIYPSNKDFNALQQEYNDIQKLSELDSDLSNRKYTIDSLILPIILELFNNDNFTDKDITSIIDKAINTYLNGNAEEDLLKNTFNIIGTADTADFAETMDGKPIDKEWLLYSIQTLSDKVNGIILQTNTADNSLFYKLLYENFKPIKDKDVTDDNKHLFHRVSAIKKILGIKPKLYKKELLSMHTKIAKIVNQYNLFFNQVFVIDSKDQSDSTGKEFKTLPNRRTEPSEQQQAEDIQLKIYESMIDNVQFLEKPKNTISANPNELTLETVPKAEPEPEAEDEAEAKDQAKAEPGAGPEAIPSSSSQVIPEPPKNIKMEQLLDFEYYKKYFPVKTFPEFLEWHNDPKSEFKPDATKCLMMKFNTNFDNTSRIKHPYGMGLHIESSIFSEITEIQKYAFYFSVLLKRIHDLYENAPEDTEYEKYIIDNGNKYTGWSKMSQTTSAISRGFKSAFGYGNSEPPKEVGRKIGGKNKKHNKRSRKPRMRRQKKSRYTRKRGGLNLNWGIADKISAVGRALGDKKLPFDNEQKTKYEFLMYFDKIHDLYINNVFRYDVELTGPDTILSPEANRYIDILKEQELNGIYDEKEELKAMRKFYRDAVDRTTLWSNRFGEAITQGKRVGNFFKKLGNGQMHVYKNAGKFGTTIKNIIKQSASFVYRNGATGTLLMTLQLVANVANVVMIVYPISAPLMGGVILAAGALRLSILVIASPFLVPPVVLLQQKSDIMNVVKNSLRRDSNGNIVNGNFYEKFVNDNYDFLAGLKCGQSVKNKIVYNVSIQLKYETEQTIRNATRGQFFNPVGKANTVSKTPIDETIQPNAAAPKEKSADVAIQETVKKLIENKIIPEKYGEDDNITGKEIARYYIDEMTNEYNTNFYNMISLMGETDVVNEYLQNKDKRNRKYVKNEIYKLQLLLKMECLKIYKELKNVNTTVLYNFYNTEYQNKRMEETMVYGSKKYMEKHVEKAIIDVFANFWGKELNVGKELKVGEQSDTKRKFNSIHFKLSRHLYVNDILIAKLKSKFQNIDNILGITIEQSNANSKPVTESKPVDKSEPVDESSTFTFNKEYIKQFIDKAKNLCETTTGYHFTMSQEKADLCYAIKKLRDEIEKQFDIALSYYDKKSSNTYPTANELTGLKRFLPIMYNIAMRGYLHYKMTPPSVYLPENSKYLNSTLSAKYIRWFINQPHDFDTVKLQTEAINYIRTKYISNKLKKQRLTIAETDIPTKIDEFNKSSLQVCSFANENDCIQQGIDPDNVELYIKERDIVQIFELWLVKNYSKYAPTNQN